MPSALTSLHEASPALAREPGPSLPEAIGHARVLPLVRVDDGERLEVADGLGAVALVVVRGLLLSDQGTMAGPGDVVLRAADGWTACMPAEVAVVGAAFAELAVGWPGAE